MLLKTLPEDFIVKEHMSFSSQKGIYTYAKLIKRNITTEQALSRLKNKLRLKQSLLYAGAKDKHALTVQYCSSKEAITHYCDEQISFFVVGKGDKALPLGSHTGNSFIIVVRKLTSIPPLPSHSFSFLNLFDKQRFSKQNALLGKHLIQKTFASATELLDKGDFFYGVKIRKHLSQYPADFLGALCLVPKMILLFYVHAYQSKLWNVLAVQSSDEEIPLIGFATPLTDEITTLLSQENIQLSDFIMPQLPWLTCEGIMRKRTVTAENFSYSVADDDLHKGHKKLIVCFCLPKGSYATLAVQHLFEHA